MPGPGELTQAVLVGQALSCTVLAGVALVVQCVVYPGLIDVGRSAPATWTVIHAHHSSRIGRVVALPWAVQGVTCAVLLVAPGGPPCWFSAVLALLGLVTVGSTLGWAVPLHTRLATGYDDALASALLRANLPRLCAWAVAGAGATWWLAR